MRQSILLLLCLFAMSSRSDRAPLSPEKRGLLPPSADTGHQEASSEKRGTMSQVLADDPVTNSCNPVIDRQSECPPSLPLLETAVHRSPDPDNRPGNGGGVDTLWRRVLPDERMRDRRQSLVSGRKIKLAQALKLVQEYGLVDCVARTACELSCNPRLYGRMGHALTRFMARVSKRNTIPGIPSSAVDFYRSSMAFGFHLKGSNCKTECKSRYSDCTRQTPSLLLMASRVDLSI